jgi:hypothetical protein
MEWPRSTVRFPEKCSPATRLNPLPTVSIHPPGPLTVSGGCTTNIPGWTADAFTLRHVLGIPKQEIWDAHTESKNLLIDYVNKETNAGMEYDKK